MSTANSGRPIWAPARWLPWALLVFALAAYSYQIFLVEQRHQGTLVDDAYISLRYAANFAAGRGLVWQAGDRVEGYTNFLEVVILAGMIRLGFDGELAAKVLGVASGALALGLLVRVARRLQTRARRPLAGWAALMVASAPAYAGWASAGLETTLFVFLILLAFVAASAVWDRPDRPGRSLLLGIILTATALTRPDGAIVVAVVLGTGLMRVIAGRRGRRRQRSKSLSLSTAVFIGLYGAYFLWRVVYYGQWLPNTFYVKVGGGLEQWQRGGRYALEMVSTLNLLPIGGLVLLGLVLWAVAVARRQPQTSVRALIGAGRRYGWNRRVALAGLIGAFGGVYAAYLIYVGGDNFGPRLALPVVASFALLADAGLTRALWLVLPLSRRHSFASRLVITGSLAAVLVIFRPWQTVVAPPDVAQIRWNEFGHWLQRNASQNDTIAVDAAGAIPYFSGLHSIDMLGLNDVHIAHLVVANMGAGTPGHEKYDPAYIFAQQPQWLATWIDKLGRPVNFGLYRWPELNQYQPYALIQTNTLSLPSMLFVGSNYDFSAGWSAGYQYLVWRHIDAVPTAGYFEIPLHDAALVRLDGDWQWKMHDVFGIDYLFTSQPGAGVAFTVPAGGTLALVSVCHSWSGQLSVRMDQTETITDLYRAGLEPQCVTRYPVPGRIGALVNVHMSVEATHDPASHSTQLFLNRLLYFPAQTP